MTACILFLLLLVSSSQAQSAWQVIETTKLDSGTTTGAHTLILEKRQDDESRLRIETPGHADFVLPIANGVVRLNDEIIDQKLISDNLLKSSYLYLSPALQDRSGRPMLLVFSNALASDPAGLNIVGFNQKNVPILIFSSPTFELKAITDLDGDKRPEIVGLHCLSQLWGDCFSTYDPYAVYQLDDRSGKAVRSVPLSKKYNLKNYYGWAGPNCSEKIAVHVCAPKGKPRLMSAAAAKRLMAK